MTTQQKFRIVAATALALALGSGVRELHAQAAASPGASGGGPQEGIKVGGHWVIEVRDPDGTLVRRHEFENGLLDNGRARLSQILTRQLTPGTWTVVVSDALCPGEPSAGGGPIEATVCLLAESSALSPGGNRFTNLSVTGDFLHLTLRGNFTAAYSGAVTSVGTGLGSCLTHVAPVSCTLPSTIVNFSATTLSTPVSVESGQIVQITVTFSFASAHPPGS